MKMRFAPLALLFALHMVAPAAAQWQVPDHAVPIGRGAGFTGFKNTPPITSGVLGSTSASTDPAFTAAPTIGTSVTTPLVIGGTGASSSLTLESTSSVSGGGIAGSPDMILLKVGQQTTAASIETPPFSGGVAILGDPNVHMAGALTGGSGYVNGSYPNVPLTGGTGTGATANITVAGGAVTSAVIVSAGTGYTFADVLSASNVNLGGSGSGFAVRAGVGNTYVPASGAAHGFFHMNAGNCDNKRSIPNTQFDIPGIGPIPAAGQMFLMGCYNDNTYGNLSNIYAVAWNSGVRYTAAVTGIGVSDAVGGNSWGGQFTAFCNADGVICQGLNIEADIGLPGAGTVNAIPATVVIGPGSAFCNSNACNATTFFNIRSNGAFVKADTIFQLNDSPHNMLTATGAIMRSITTNISTQDGIDLRNMAFSGKAFAAANFSVDGGTGYVTSPRHYGGTAVGSQLILKGTSNGSPSGDKVSFQSGTRDVWGFKQNPAGDVGGTYVECWPGNTASSQNAECDVISSIANAGLSFRMKGTFPLALHAPSDQSQSALMCLYENEVNGTDRMCWQTAASIASSFTLVWPNAVPAANGYALTSTTAGVMSWQPIKSQLANSTGATIGAGATGFFTVSGFAGADVVASAPIAFAMTARNFYAKGHGPPGAAQTFTYTLMKNGAATAITCVVSGAVASTCSDLANTVSYAAGDTYSVRIVNSAGGAVVVHTASFELDPT